MCSLTLQIKARIPAGGLCLHVALKHSTQLSQSTVVNFLLQLLVFAFADGIRERSFAEGAEMAF